MRKGTNPEKKDNLLDIDQYHRVIIPVYIPNLTEDYFKEALVILKLCTQSLLKTIHSKTKISIIDNGCCTEVSDYLKSLHQDYKCIDQLLLSKVNLGKINALYSVIKSNLEPLITVADADVMFLPNWQTEIEKVFVNFPEAGMVSPVPNSMAYRNSFLNSTVYYGLFKGRVKFEKVVSPEGLMAFQDSIGRKMYDDIHLEKYITISNDKGSAVMGCGHFVATLRSEVFKNAPNEVSLNKIGGGSVNKYIDIPNDKAGLLRLATKGNFAYHLGNVFEPWMDQEINKLSENSSEMILLDNLPKAKPINKLQYQIGKLLRKVLFHKYRKQYFKLKGVNQPY
ncbi:MAG: hypothetical protein CMO82_08650 [Winogradskyella sp.]|nr:hypothetical protein [Winogradskyella sp.]|tara:strand:- start:21094 stop:22107 length:1014 start_codon:yes stop_codon:yes gene_type:complete